MTDPMISLKMAGIRKRFGATVALDGVDLDVTGGEVLALVGENGAGKSTLMKVLSGVHRPDQGQMWLSGQPYHPRSPLHARRMGVAMIYQELSLALHLSVEQNIVLGMEPTRFGFVRQSDMRRRALAALKQLGHAEIDPAASVRWLSPAQRQIVEIARAIAIGCRILVLDEPTSSLGQGDVRQLFDLITRLRDQGHAIIYISHFIEEVKEVASRFVVLRDGRTVGSGRTADVTPAQIVSMMAGRDIADLYPRSRRSIGEVVLEIDQLTGRQKPTGATLSLCRGEVLGIAGLIGAGRSEMLRSIFGLDPVVSGRVKVASFTPLAAATPRQRWREGVGMLSEDRKSEGLALSMSVADNLTLSRMKGLGPALTVLPSRQAAASHKWIERLAIRCSSPWQRVLDLSGGNQQKVALARLLHHQADVLLLDEPTRGIDVGAKAEIYRVIDELALAGRAVLVVSSYLPELLGICDRIAVMSRGRLVDVRTTEQWTEHSLLMQATGAAPT